MAKNLVIVESPAKAKTIENYLGIDYQVASSNGHIRDLIKGNNAVNVAQGFLPSYEITPGKERVVQHLKKLAKESTCVYLASDDDREGESISWHLKEALQLTDDKVQRIVFREITKTAVLNALKQPRAIDLDLVDAQQARRVLDRLVGYDLSPLLWKKIKPGLSAGRVQSVAVRMVVERERAIDNFVVTFHFSISAFFPLPTGQLLKADLPEKFKTEQDALAFLEQCKDAAFSIKALDKKALKRSPSAPFITSTLQQEASRKLGYSVTRTMILAQQLYETGKISYMRTDSLNLSADAVQHISKEVTETYGKEYFHARSYKTKSSTAQEAHEAIRPTDFSAKIVSNNRDEQRLYELIWSRAMASQMADAQIEKTVATIQISTSDQTLVATGEVLKFEGFLKAYARAKDEDEESDDAAEMLPPLHIGQVLPLEKMLARQRFANPPPRYTEAALVRDLEEREIGRPSTYAPIISTIQKRGYIKLESREGFPRSYTLLTLENKQIQTQQLTEIVRAEKQKLFPTDIAAIVNDFLVKHFSDVTDYNFTAHVEKELDKIAQGSKIWNQMLAEFYSVFYTKIQSTSDVDRSMINHTRYLGKDPETNASVVVRLGKYGPLVQLGVEADERQEAPRFAGLRPNQRMETITLEAALDLFKLPREIGIFEEAPMVVNIGRFGPYIKHGSSFYSIGKENDPFTIGAVKAIEIITTKRKADAEKLIKTFPDSEIQILNGRWGAYIKSEKKNVRIPKDIPDPKLLSLEECLKILEHNAAKKGKKDK
ncbi:type I DNA topoisomerase [Cardinium endosymbiont of Culicoides punctatus]|uniref:type I DNA topoisomerase n=1 Tax=Cardinium endosymbiont of Culicoides punctatus TaxID=2304601 RepID=UPI001058F606|nr:type I DNA topoisomerase [Cardinium endosymbiont of Culicoides punctatus]TDG95393.1 DNA topoisomerase 1 [Cardinium endosymbiont of Culicoides punctatus]